MGQFIRAERFAVVPTEVSGTGPTGQYSLVCSCMVAICCHMMSITETRPRVAYTIKGRCTRVHASCTALEATIPVFCRRCNEENTANRVTGLDFDLLLPFIAFGLL